jgi:hypothetical protein
VYSATQLISGWRNKSSQELCAVAAVKPQPKSRYISILIGYFTSTFMFNNDNTEGVFGTFINGEAGVLVSKRRLPLMYAFNL